MDTEFQPIQGAMTRAALRYEQEVTLVDQLAALVSQGSVAWLRQTLVREFDYSSGRTDLLTLTVTDHVVAFEAKLTNWRKAMDQAWRNTSFANEVYVVLPRACSRPALQHRADFEDSGVGLCVMDENGVDMLWNSRNHKPVIPWLHHKARASLGEDGSGPARGIGATDLC